MAEDLQSLIKQRNEINEKIRSLIENEKLRLPIRKFIADNNLPNGITELFHVYSTMRYYKNHECINLELECDGNYSCVIKIDRETHDAYEFCIKTSREDIMCKYTVWNFNIFELIEFITDNCESLIDHVVESETWTYINKKISPGCGLEPSF